MTTARAGIVLSFTAVVLTASLVSVLSGPVNAAVTASPTADVPISVIIPGPSTTATPTPTPTPSPSSSSNSGSSGSSGTGSTPGSTPGGSTSTGTNADGSPIPASEPTEDAPELDLDLPTYSLGDLPTYTIGDWIIVTGTGYKPGEKVQFVLYPGGIVLGSYTADASGTVNARIKLPQDTRPGEYVIEATGWESGHVTNRGFMVVAPATVVPWLWWVLVVLGVLLIGTIALSIYFRESIRQWFSGGVPVAGSAP